MAKFRNVSGQELFIPWVGKAVPDDGVFVVSDEQAPSFECQPTNYARIDEPARKAPKESE